MTNPNQNSSSVKLRFLSEPSSQNFGGKVHGGLVMKWIDQAGYVCATQWSNRYCVTISVSHIRFNKPIAIGSLIEVSAKVSYTGNTSIHIWVEVKSEDLKTRQQVNNTHCLISFVSINDEGKPCPVKKWLPQTKEEHEKEEETKKRIESQKQFN